MPRVVLDPSLGVIASAFGCARRGASHKRAGTCCQDAHLLADMSISGFPMLFAAVADGHGSKQHDRSHIGAHLALQAAMQTLGWLLLGVRQDVESACDSFSNEAKAPSPSDSECLDKEALVSNLTRNFRDHFPRMLCRLWRELICLHGKNRADPEATLSDPLFIKRYGTTLLVAALIGDAVLLAQIGDGDIALLGKDEKNELQVSFPLAGTDDLVAGETHSLCSEDASRLFRTGIRPRNGVSMITLSTDGLRNAYEKEESFRNLLVGIRDNIRAYGSTTANGVLPEYFDRFSDHGSGDDITLAGIYLERPTITETANRDEVGDLQSSLRRT